MEAIGINVERAPILPPPQNSWWSIRYLCITVLITYFCKFMLSISLNLPAIATEPLQEAGVLQTPIEVGLFSSLSDLSCAIIGLCAWTLVDRFGRRPSMMIGLAFFAVGWCFIFPMTKSVYVGQVLAGAGVGYTSIVAYLYIGEVAMPAHRGKLALGVNLCATIGSMMMALLSIFITVKYVAVVGICVSILDFLAAAVFFEESPRWLAKKRRLEEAEKVLQKLRGQDTEIADEYNDIIANTCDSTRYSLSLFKTPRVWKSVLVATMLMFTPFICGMIPIARYTTDIVKDAGWTEYPYLALFISYTGAFVGAIIGIPIIDRAGRRFTILGSLIVIIFSLTIWAVPSYVKAVYGTTPMKWLSITCGFLYMATANGIIYPACNIIAAEFVPLSVRAITISILVFGTGMFAFLMSLTYPLMFASIGIYSVLWIHAGATLLLTFIMWRYLPETKGRTLEEIDAIFSE